MFINYTLLYDGDVFQTDLRQLIATNRNLPKNWCTRIFTDIPSIEFAGMPNALRIFRQHLDDAENGEKEKFQIVVDSDLDGIASAAVLYKYLNKFYPHIETVYSLHSGKQHGLSDDVVIEDNITLVILPDAGR